MDDSVVVVVVVLLTSAAENRVDRPPRGFPLVPGAKSSHR